MRFLPKNLVKRYIFSLYNLNPGNVAPVAFCVLPWDSSWSVDIENKPGSLFGHEHGAGETKSTVKSCTTPYGSQVPLKNVKEHWSSWSNRGRIALHAYVYCREWNLQYRENFQPLLLSSAGSKFHSTSHDTLKQIPDDDSAVRIWNQKHFLWGRKDYVFVLCLIYLWNCTAFVSLCDVFCKGSTPWTRNSWGLVTLKIRTVVPPQQGVALRSERRRGGSKRTYCRVWRAR